MFFISSARVLILTYLVFGVYKVESDHPEYHSRFRCTQQLVDVEFSSLQVKLHQEALLNLIDVSTRMLPPRCVCHIFPMQYIKHKKVCLIRIFKHREVG